MLIFSDYFQSFELHFEIFYRQIPVFIFGAENPRVKLNIFKKIIRMIKTLVNLMKNFHEFN